MCVVYLLFNDATDELCDTFVPHIHLFYKSWNSVYTLYYVSTGTTQLEVILYLFTKWTQFVPISFLHIVTV